MTLVILAAGLGSRYGGLKQLDPMTDHGEVIVDFSIYDAKRAGFDKVVFIIKEENLELFRETIGVRVEPHIQVEYAFQTPANIPAGCTVPEGRTKPLGTGHAVYCVRDLVKENFAVINADDFYGRDTFMQLAKHLKDAGVEKGVAHHCMVGFRLGNTITENGTVSRGQCVVSDAGMLQSVTERTKIQKTATGASYLSEDESTWIDLPLDTIVSMNCWGFTPEIFDDLESDFTAFLQDLKTSSNPLKAEYYLPFAVDTQRQKGLCDIKVYPTQSQWLGVTYPEDKAQVKASIKALIEAGEYPSVLWES
ncbi:MAG: NTP transferase domain-containing protein [Clostridia bacterium]|nr:NTP transferase domain-containing protein [Clostridia bacterium]